ncbi:conserved hypothetical protein, secreted [Candidatus Magnetobacterium bavaricum]|uniref:Bacterial repeat domain-containing protein n=1 Tax=Candidatus Magnetobacterium bavaricum TaxID=29290 RepID=A0A0F3GT52_9BACT|nr:conserved hypothetical protein, secreted [Candidatus Magnetobacterium bavaricum]
MLLVLVAVIGVMCLAGAAYADPLDTWTLRNSGTTDGIGVITYGNGTFVAAGALGSTGNATILTSTDNGVTWTSKGTGYHNVNLRGIAYGNGTFVVVGSDCSGETDTCTDFILTSTDNGVTWTSRNTGTNISHGIDGITYGNGTFVVVGYNGTIFTSTDNGVTWTSRNSGTTIPLNGIAYGNGTFVAIGNNADISNPTCVVTTIIATSTDNGVTWTPRTFVSPLNGITYGNGIFASVGASSTELNLWCFQKGSAIFTSADNGVTWTSRNSEATNPLWHITYGNGTFVAMESNRIFTSADNGATWISRNSGTTNSLRDIAYGGGTFVAVGASGTILTSTVGTNPTPTPTPTQYTITASVDYGTGSISCTPNVVASGGTSTCTVTPGSGQMLVSLTDNGTNVTSKVTGLTYTITDITANHTIVATFATTSVCTSVTITPTSKNFPASGGIGNVSVTTGTNCSFTFSSDASWITNLSGTPGGVNNDIASYTISYAVTPNTDTSQRTGTITISGQTFTVTQEGQATDVTLTVVKAGEGSGAVTITPPGIDCSMNTPSAECRVPFAQGTSVTLTAAADAGSTFTGWSGDDCSGTTSTCTLTMSAAKNVTATFNAAPKPKHTTHDFDGDGKADLLWHNILTGQLVMFFMDGTSIASPKVLPNLEDNEWQAFGAWQILKIGDFNGDGKADILWENRMTGELVIWLMDGEKIASAGLLALPGGDWQILGLGDFNDDGKSDILWQDIYSGMVAIWLMDGTSIVTGGIGSPETLDTENWQMFAIGDFNGDGKSDILWQNLSTNQVAAWYMDGTNISKPLVFDNGVPVNWMIMGAGDFDGDGRADILWQDYTTGEVAIWLMDGTKNSLGKISGEWKLSGIRDFDGDGKADMLWQNVYTNQVAILLMDGASISSKALLGLAPDINAWYLY